MNITTLKRRAKAGDVLAQHSLAVAYAIGDGVDTDPKEARYWYMHAATQGDADAAYNLGAMYLSGEGGGKSKKHALSWLRKASAMGSGDASVWLGETAMANSEKERALRHFTVAIMQGDMRGLRGVAMILSQSNDSVVRKWSKVIQRELGS